MFEITLENKIAHLRLNRPERRNALSKEFWIEFPDTVRELGESGEYRVIVISGAGKDFCSGIDLEIFADRELLGTGTARQRDRLRTVVIRLQQCLDVLSRVRVPVIAAVQGACMGAGLDLVSACDIRFATASAYFVIQEINLGIMADLGTLQRLPGKMPEGIVRELAFTGEKLSAGRACELGFVNAVLDDDERVVEKALETAALIAGKAPLAVSHSKDCLNYRADHSLADSLEFAASRQAFMLDPAEILASMKNKNPDFEDLHSGWKGFGED
ncbi:MAG: enoyl-CoA hydratase/isomerase family protein [Cyanobacteria bacterium HKST-UBA02]|nr:enoyl-CoA hydratase/isomerase family protein [Cyanobacteria bacterium HKST-UBA02]